MGMEMGMWMISKAKLVYTTTCASAWHYGREFISVVHGTKDLLNISLDIEYVRNIPKSFWLKNNNDPFLFSCSLANKYDGKKVERG